MSRIIAWVAFVLGVVASVAANVAHARPEAGPRIAAGFAPVALLLGIELVARVQWPAGWRWWLGRWAGTGMVAIVAAITSYRHMHALLVSYGEDGWTSRLQPLAVDGLMVTAAVALLALGAAATPAVTTSAPAVPSVRADIGPDAQPDIKPAGEPAAAADTRTAQRTPDRTQARTSKADTAASVARLRVRHPDMSPADIAKRLGVTDRTVRRHLADGQSYVTPIRDTATN